MTSYSRILIIDAYLSRLLAFGEDMYSKIDVHDPIMADVRRICQVRGWAVPKEPVISDLLVWVVSCYHDSTCMYEMARQSNIRLYEPINDVLASEAPLFRALHKQVNGR